MGLVGTLSDRVLGTIRPQDGSGCDMHPSMFLHVLVPTEARLVLPDRSQLWRRNMLPKQHPVLTLA